MGPAPDGGEGPQLEQDDAISAVQLTSIVGSKGLSADHVIVLGCDAVNLARISRSAFFVAMTRARRSLTLLAAMGGGGAKELHPFLLALPDRHTDAWMAKAKGLMDRYATTGALQEHLASMQFARAQGAKRGRR